MADKLTPKQARFVQAYLANGRNSAEAYRTAYNTKASAQRCTEEGWRLCVHPNIAPILAQADLEASAAMRQTLDRYNIDQEGCIRRLCMLADYDHREVFKWTENGVALRASTEISDQASYAISEIREGPNGLTVKLADKRAALMDIAKLRGWIVERGQQLGADGKPIDPAGNTFIIKVER